jgi:transcriptional regulator with XRE-family HTH domain
MNEKSSWSTTGSPELGEILRRARTEVGISQNALARIAGLHQSTVHKIEAGSRGLGAVTIAKITPHVGPRFRTEVMNYYRRRSDGHRG